MSQEQKKSSASSTSSSSTTTRSQDSKSSAPALVLPKALPIGDAKVAALLKPIEANIAIKPRYRDTVFADEIFAEPYFCDTGDVYEWEQITHWLKTHNTNPKTNEELESKKLRPAKDKQEDVQEFLDEHPELRNSKELYLPRHWVKELEQACQEGDVATIKRLCERDKRLLSWTFNFDKEEGLVDPADYERWRGKTMLQLACRTGAPEAITQLITLAEQRSPGLALQLLLQADEGGWLPFHHAIANEQSVETLLTLMAHMGDHLDKIVLPEGWKVDNASVLDDALTHCVLEQDLVGIRFFLRCGADPNTTNDQGESLVYLAAQAGGVESLKVLLEAKASPNQQDEGLDDTPLHAAVRAGHRDVVLLLKKYGVDLTAALENGSTALHEAAASGVTALITTLCGEGTADEAGALPAALREVPDAKGYTPLHRAILAGSAEMVQWFLAKKSSVTSQNAEGQNVLHLAAAYGHTEIVQLMLKQEVAVNAQDQAGNTALHLAASAGNSATLTALLRAGSSPQIKNKAGQTAQQCAANQETSNCYNTIVAELRAKEVEALKAQGPLGLMLLQQQELIQQQQAQLEHQKMELARQQIEMEALRKELAQLKKVEASSAPQQKLVNNQQTGSGHPKNKVNPLQKGKESAQVAGVTTKPVPSSSLQKSAHSGSGFGLFEEKRALPPTPDPKQIERQNARARQEQLQRDLIEACKKGDEKETSRLIKEGADPNRPDNYFVSAAKAKQAEVRRDSLLSDRLKAGVNYPSFVGYTGFTSEHPLGAAIWGMNPAVVKTLLQAIGGVPHLTWEEYVEHNEVLYGGTFCLNFRPATYLEWINILECFRPSPFLQMHHLNIALKHGVLKNGYASTFERNMFCSYSLDYNWKELLQKVEDLHSQNGEEVWRNGYRHPRPPRADTHPVVAQTRSEFEGFQAQIKQAIEAASKPKPGMGMKS